MSKKEKCCSNECGIDSSVTALLLHVEGYEVMCHHENMGLCKFWLGAVKTTGCMQFG